MSARKPPAPAPRQPSAGAASGEDLDRFLAAVEDDDRPEVGRFLDLYPAAVEGEDSMERRPLVTAAAAGHKDMTALLLERGAVIDKKDSEGNTALVYAVRDGHLPVIALLLERGADINSPDNDGWTPLMQAAFLGQKEAVGLLLERGADHTLRNKAGETALAIVKMDNLTPEVSEPIARMIWQHVESTAAAATAARMEKLKRRPAARPSWKAP